MTPPRRSSVPVAPSPKPVVTEMKIPPPRPALNFEFGRICDEDMKTSDFLQSKEYFDILDRVKEASSDRAKVEDHIK